MNFIYCIYTHGNYRRTLLKKNSAMHIHSHIHTLYIYTRALGGGLISGPSQPGDVDMNVVVRRVTNHVQNELSMFKTSFRSDVENHMERFVNLVSCIWSIF